MNRYVGEYISLVSGGFDIRGAYSLVCRNIALNGVFDDLVQVSELHEEDCRQEFEFMLDEAKKATAPTVTKESFDTL